MAWQESRPSLAIAGGIALVHLAVAARLGFFRDELYFIDCGRHPSFGYVDQPPLIPLLAAASQVFGAHLAPLRMIPGLAHAGLALLCSSLAGLVAREIGLEGRFARPLAAAAVGLAPMYLGLHGTLNTTSLEPLAWTAVAYLTARAVLCDRPRALWIVGIVAGVAMEAKYAMPFFLAPLVIGLLLGPSRKVLLSRHAIIALVIAAGIALPSVVWQVSHGLPFLEVLRAGANGKNVQATPVSFVSNQLMVMNPVLAPLWLSGICAAFLSRALVRVRFLAIGFVGVFLEMLVLHGKDYYVAPAYGIAFALGAVVAERHLRSTAARLAWIGLAVPFAALGAPVALPILDPPALVRYLRVIPAGPQPQEHNQESAILPQNQADMLGWPELEAKVAEVYRTLSPDERRRVAILTSNYGEAGALNFFGPVDGLPRAISGHNQYFLWGPGDNDASVVIRVNGDLEAWRRRCADVTIAARFGAPYVMPYENDRPILLCRGLFRPLKDTWAGFKHYG